MALGAKRHLNKTKHYLLSIYKNKKTEYTTVEELDEISAFLFLDTAIIPIDAAVENHGKYKQLHEHILVTVPTSFRFKSLCRYPKFKIHWRHVHNDVCGYNIANVMEYIHKYNKSMWDEHVILNDNILNNKYCFIDDD